MSVINCYVTIETLIASRFLLLWFMTKQISRKFDNSRSTKTVLRVELDETVKDNKFFHRVKEINICRPEIFSFGCLNSEIPPKRVKEKAFAYCQSLIPSLESLYKDWITTTQNQIINEATERNTPEKAKEISEFIGVAVSLQYFVQLIGIKTNRIKKILPTGKKEKRLDFMASKNGRDFEIESKCTTYKQKIQEYLEDIQKKKKDQEKNNNNITRIGVVIKANSANDASPSKIIVADSFNLNNECAHYSIYDFLGYYQFVLSVILDNPQYNKMARFIFGDKKLLNTTSALFIARPNNRSYFFREREFIGYFFDRRLILDVIKQYTKKEIANAALFSILTKRQGRHKIFLGVEKNVFEALASRRLNVLLNYKCEEYYEVLFNVERYLGDDGVLVVFSTNGADKQTEEIFPESEVRGRLGMIDRFLANTPHKCGAPCRSKEIEGKPCEKLTFKEYCHFHR